MAARVRAVYYDDDSDPLSRALRPPPNETPQQATERMVKHKAANLVSREIDERILEDKKALERKHNAVKILLLGQSESGKSTTLRSTSLICL
jgi:guanine nucleotide-binding protein alpha-1 subunit